MAGSFVQFMSNPIITAAFCGWLAAQIIKVVSLSIKNNAWSFRYFLSQGGMPSSHASLVCALAFSVLLVEGISTSFIVALILALIVIKDAIGVRHEVSKHARVINKINKDAKLSEHEGHTSLQAFAGSILGILVALIVVKTSFSMFFVLQVIYFILPAVAANAMPVLMSRLHPEWNSPVDFGNKWKGRPIFGKNKTWRGIFSGALASVLVINVQGFLYVFQSFRDLSLFNYPYFNLWILGLAIALGVLGGDLIESFVKRRLGIAPGASFFPWDQIDSLIGGFVVLIIFYQPIAAKALTFPVVLTIILAAFVLHCVFNGIKEDLKWT